MKTLLSSLVFTFCFFFPKKAFSWLCTRLVYFRLPLALSNLFIKGFARIYDIPISEAEKPLKDYSCIGDFFSRKLASGLRPIASAPCVHPVDASLLGVQSIAGHTMYQAKGQTYSLWQLLGEGENKKQEFLSFWERGLAFTYYLCPRDYHRIHCPFDAKIVKARRLKGTLWPVHAWARKNVPRLFCRNERVLIYLQSTENPQVQGVLVCIGALNVGSISLSFASPNSSFSSSPLTSNLTLKKGQEAAAFRMGSSVVFLCNAHLQSQFQLHNDFSLTSLFHEKKVQMGEAIKL